MKAIMPIFILLSFAFFTVQTGFAQKSIKQSKQQTDFFYTQLNANGGLIFDDNARWTFSEVSPNSNVNFTYRSKNQRLLQRGYTRNLHLSGFKSSLALVYKNQSNADGVSQAQIGLQMRDLWLKVNTKWDRTSFKVGHFSLPFGHDPKIDLDNSFIPALASQDLGFNRDFGIQFKTPVSKSLDLEAALTLGGTVPTTLLSYELSAPAVAEKDKENTKWTAPNFDYQGNWLATFRLGNPTFYKNELGLFAAVGKVSRTAFTGTQSFVYRLGGDWTYKFKEQFRISNQAVTGMSITEAGERSFSLHQKTGLDYFWKRQWILSLTNSWEYQQGSETEALKGVAVMSVAYALNPHTRLKLNTYAKYDNVVGNTLTTGVFLQLVTGLGKRG